MGKTVSHQSPFPRHLNLSFPSHSSQGVPQNQIAGFLERKLLKHTAVGSPPVLLHASHPSLLFSAETVLNKVRVHRPLFSSLLDGKLG